MNWGHITPPGKLLQDLRIQTGLGILRLSMQAYMHERQKSYC